MTTEDNRRSIEHRLTTLEERFKSLETLQKDVHDIVLKFNKYEARWGMLLIIGTALWSVFVAFKSNIMQFLGADDGP